MIALMSSNFLLLAAENVVNDSAKFNSVSKVVNVGSPGWRIWTEAPLFRCFSGAVIFKKDRCPQLRLVVGLLVKRPLRGLPLMANLMTIFEGLAHAFLDNSYKSGRILKTIRNIDLVVKNVLQNDKLQTSFYGICQNRMRFNLNKICR